MLGRLVFVLLVLSCTASYAQQSLSYSVPHSYWEVVAAIERVVNEPRKRPFKVPNLPALIHGKDFVVTTSARPATREYRASVKLVRPIGRLTRFDHSIVVRGLPDHYEIRSSIDIDWRWNICLGSRIVQRVVSKAECMVLQLERRKVAEYNARIETPEVEQPDSWLLIGIDLFRLAKRAWGMRKDE